MGADGVHLHADHRLVALVEVVASIDHHIAGERGYIISVRLECEQVQHFSTAFDLGGPNEARIALIGGQQSAHRWVVQIAHHLAGVLHQYGTDHCTFAGAVVLEIVVRIENVEQGVVRTHRARIGRERIGRGHIGGIAQRIGERIARSGNFFNRLDVGEDVFCSFACSLSFSALFGEQGLELFVGRIEITEHLNSFIQIPKLELCGALQEFFDAFGIFHTGQFDQDAARVVLESLNVGLNHPELVDPRPENRKDIRNRGLDLSGQFFFDELVGGIKAHHIVNGLGAKQLRIVESHTRTRFAQFGQKSGEVIVLTVPQSFVRISKRFDKGGVFGIAHQSGQNVADLHLEDDVHPPAQVETQIEFLLFYLSVGHLVYQNIVDLYIGHAVEVGLLLERVTRGISKRLALDVSAHERERQLIDARQCEKNGEQPYNSLILHYLPC